MKKKQPWLQTMVAIALAASAVLPGVPVSAEDPELAKTEQLIVKYKNDKTFSNKQKKKIGVETVEESDEVGLYDVKEESVDATITEIENMDNVEYVEKNVTYKTAETMEPNDTYYKKQWNLPAIDAQGAWERINSSNLVKIAVLDTGVQGTHEDLNGRVLEGKSFVAGYEEIYQGDDQGHGTFVSGIIAANANNEKGITGVAGHANVSILPVKVMNKSGVGDAFNIASGIDYAVAHGVDVINLSLSGEYSEKVETAVHKATEKGIVVVAASGNGGGNADASYTAALPNVLSVGAIAPKDQVYERSNYGSTLDIVAPGVSVLSTSLTVIDRTAPTVKVAAVTDQSTAVSIKTEKNAQITFTAKGMTYTKPVYKNGTYSLKIAKLPANTKWTVTVRDQAGNATKKSGVVLDKTAPKAATVQKVTTKTTVVKGKAEKKATVTIYKGKKKMKSGKVSKKGTFSIKIPKQKEGTTLLLVVQDAAKINQKQLK